MFGWPLRQAAVVAAGGALALYGAAFQASPPHPVSTFASPHPASSPASSHPASPAPTWWRIAGTFGALHGQAALTSISAPSALDAWATGFTVQPAGLGVAAMIRHWTGKAWQDIRLPAGLARTWNNAAPILAQIGASSASNVWVFNGIMNGPARYLRLNGTHWTAGTLPGGGGEDGPAVLITAAKVFSPSNVWAFGMTESFGSQGTTSPYAAHFDGKSWATLPVPGQGAITSVSAVSASDMWAVVGSVTTQRIAPGAMPAVLQWAAQSGWRRAPVQPKLPRGAQLSSVMAARGGAVWVGGEAENSLHGTTPLAATWTGSAWTVTELPIAASSARWGIAELAANGDGLWAVIAAQNADGHQLWHLMGTKWSKASPGFGWHVWQIGQLAAIPGTHSMWAAGAIRYGATVDAMVALDGPTASVVPVHRPKKPAHHKPAKTSKPKHSKPRR